MRSVYFYNKSTQSEEAAKILLRKESDVCGAWSMIRGKQITLVRREMESCKEQMLCVRAAVTVEDRLQGL